MKLLFVRHGDPNYERDCLNELGLREARALVPRLKQMRVSEILVSPMGRAAETAKVAMGLDAKADMPESFTGPDGGKAPVRVVDWLHEFDVYKIRRPNGEEGIPWDWLPADWTEYDEFYDPDRWLTHPSIAESEVPDRYRDVCSTLDGMLAGHGYVRKGRTYRVERESRDTVVLFTHYGLTCVALSHLLNISPMQLWHGICMCPASVTSVTTEERRQGIASFRTDYIGERSHLAAAGLDFNPNARFAEIFSAEDERHD